jgi:hypothetical protein
MKTAMQELKDWANQYKGQMISADQVVLQAHKLLEKEKEQIQKAFSYGIVDAYNIIEDEANQYYNETYNQNK